MRGAAAVARISSQWAIAGENVASCCMHPSPAKKLRLFLPPPLGVLRRAKGEPCVTKGEPCAPCGVVTPASDVTDRCFEAASNTPRLASNCHSGDPSNLGAGEIRERQRWHGCAGERGMGSQAVLGSSRNLTCRGGAGERGMGGSAGFEPQRHLQGWCRRAWHGRQR